MLIEQLMKEITDSMDNSTLMKRVRNTLNDLIVDCDGPDSYDMDLDTWQKNHDAIKVLEELNTIIDKVDDLVEEIYQKGKTEI